MDITLVIQQLAELSAVLVKAGFVFYNKPRKCFTEAYFGHWNIVSTHILLGDTQRRSLCLFKKMTQV